MSQRKSSLTGIRRWWYSHYRMQRIVRRETAKAHMDLILYGSCFILHTDTPDYIRHVPLQDTILRGPQ